MEVRNPTTIMDIVKLFPWISKRISDQQYNQADQFKSCGEGSMTRDPLDGREMGEKNYNLQEMLFSFEA